MSNARFLSLAILFGSKCRFICGKGNPSFSSVLAISTFSIESNMITAIDS